MNSEDWAVVVGVQNYPGITDLQGSENDARRFYEWLISPTGGGIPVSDDPPAAGQVARSELAAGNQAVLILSSNYNPPFLDANDALPTDAEILRAFGKLKSLSSKNFANDGSFRVGRRLYLYFAGHGFAPTFGSVPSLEDAALLTANAEYKAPGFHISGRPYANWFFIGGLFDEVVLLMDCCRDNYPSCPANPIKYDVLTTPRPLDESKLFLGFGTKWNRQSRERIMDDGNWHGVFTTALLAGLQGAAAGADGLVTARTLGNYLYNYMKIYFSDEERSDAAIEKEPTLKYHPVFGDRIVFNQLNPAPKFPIKINFPPAVRGKNIEITSERNGQKNAFVQAVAADAPSKTILIEPGFYTLRASGNGVTEKVIEVIGYISAGGKETGKVKSGESEEKDYVEFGS